MNVAVVGAGKMGLPLACQFAARGAAVTACDRNPAVVDAIQAGRCLIDEPGVPELLQRLVRDGRLRATTDTAEAVAASEVVVVIVPAVLTAERTIDTTHLVSASQQIARGLHVGMLVCYETTLPVGGTRRYLQPILEQSGFRAGEQFDLAFSPERVKSQRVLQHLTETPKIVGGITPSAAQRAEVFYHTYLGAPVLNLGSLEAAEFAKLAGMLYRDVNIALANELARYAEAVGVHLPPVLEAANTDGESCLLQPGIGVGGHCTPVYPYFLIRDAHARKTPVTLAERARRVNDQQGAHLLDRVEREWGSLRGRRVLILGLGFRPQVKEHAYSPAFLLREELRRRGAEVFLHDPLYDREELRVHGFTAGSLEETPVPEVLILNTAHALYAALDFSKLQQRGVQIVVDGRNVWNPDQIRAAGIVSFGVGRPSVPDRHAPSESIPIARPFLAGEEAEAAAEAVRSGWIMQGPQVAAFEREFAEFVGAPHACAVSSGTAALHLALLAVGVRPGDEVVTVSHSYIATANSIRYCGAVPVFVDIEAETFNADPALLETALSPRTKAILCVHQLGMPCDLAAVLKIAQRAGLPVIEDAACAVGSEILWGQAWQRIGRPHGDIACFSFHPRKLLTTGDGGMITTANPAWDQQCRTWRHHGLAPRQGTEGSYPVLGYNYRLTDLQAAVGRAQLARLPALVAHRREQVQRYRALLADIPGLRPPSEPAWARSNWQSFCVYLPEGVDQRSVIRTMAEAGISLRPGVMCAHREGAYAIERWSCGPGPGRCGCSTGTCARLQKSERAQAQTIILPLYPEMTVAEQERVIEMLRRTLVEVPVTL